MTTTGVCDTVAGLKNSSTFPDSAAAVSLLPFSAVTVTVGTGRVAATFFARFGRALFRCLRGAVDCTSGRVLSSGSAEAIGKQERNQENGILQLSCNPGE